MRAEDTCPDIVKKTEISELTIYKGRAFNETYNRNAQRRIPESLLPSSIPNLQLDNFTTNINQLAAKFNTDGMRGISLN
jgi:hypothetical protein